MFCKALSLWFPPFVLCKGLKTTGVLPCAEVRTASGHPSCSPSPPAESPYLPLMMGALPCTQVCARAHTQTHTRMHTHTRTLAHAQTTAEQALQDLRLEKEGLAQALAEEQQQRTGAREAAGKAEQRVGALEAELAEE